ncbi:MAG: L-seryl-tRNA(Sec) selenium transferase [bacterium]|nr:L-seryl-tRNA(Sec) selenium transferase [bacterium]
MPRKPKIKGKNPALQTALAQLPSVEFLLSLPEIENLHGRYSHDFLTFICRRQINNVRKELTGSGSEVLLTREALIEKILSNIRADINRTDSGSVIPAINATGVILHTGLGRAPLSSEAISHIKKVMKGYSTLEIDVGSGNRGKRESYLEEVLCFLTGAEAATVVNNNAAAVLISLNTAARGKEVIVSRGELVEIGGSFRMPDIMEASGSKMVEIGTTNKTKLSDYEKAMNRKTGAVLSVHTSNYRVMGFSESVDLKDLCKLAKSRKLPVIYDLGAGVLFDFRDFGLPYEPVVPESLMKGADIVTFSGDKVLGGPQSGIIVGKKKYIDSIKKNPIARAVRCDKLILAGLEGTLKSYQKGIKEFKKLPAIKMLLEPPDRIRERAEKVLEKTGRTGKNGLKISITESKNQIGSGSLPLEHLESFAITLHSGKIPAERITRKLREFDPPVFGYIRDEKVYLDMRTVFKDQVKTLTEAVKSLSDK